MNLFIVFLLNNFWLFLIFLPHNFLLQGFL